MTASKRVYRRGEVGQSKQVAEIHVGEFDEMSRSALRTALPLCRGGCTRVAGHAESNGWASQHCRAPGPDYTALEVW